MADEQPEKTGKSILAEQLIKLNLEVNYDDKQLQKDLDPVMSALTKKLEGISKASKINEGMFGKGFFEKTLKGFTGFDTSLVKGIKNLIAYGQASKNLNADNKEFYNSLNFMGKGLVSLADKWRKKSDAEKKASEQSKETKSELANLDEQVARMEGMDKANNGTNLLSANLEALGPEAANAAKGVEGMTVATEEATVAVEIFASVATLGLAAVVAAVVLVTKTIYQMIVQAVNTRAEFKKFDELFGGIGSKGIQDGIQTLSNLNKELWGLGFSMEKVNENVLNLTKNGLNFSRAVDTDLNASILMLAGASGEAAGEIGKLYGELLKTTKIEEKSVETIGNSWVAFNRFAKSTTTLGRVSFGSLNEAISSSANAMGIAANKGKGFTDSMIKDLTVLSGLATNLSVQVSELNHLFESAGSMITEGDSPFRTLLAISGGANINQMMSNQFNKTDAMLKSIVYLQNLNKSFGNNIQLTAQVAAQQLGVSKEMAIKMINMRKDQIDDMQRAQSEMEKLRNDEARDAFEKVNSDLGSMWERIKTMFSTFFFRAFGSSEGMQRLVGKLEEMMKTLQNFLEDSDIIQSFGKTIQNIATWIADNLVTLIQWVTEQLQAFADPSKKNPILVLWDKMIDALSNSAVGIGMNMAKGFARGSVAVGTFGLSEYAASLYEQFTGGVGNTSGNSKNAAEQALRDANSKVSSDLSANKSRQGELSKESDKLDKYSPEAVTYGRDAKDNVGFMTVGQKQFAIEEEKRKLEEKSVALLTIIAKNTEKQNDSPNKSVGASAADQASPINPPWTQGYDKALNGLPSGI